MKKLLTFSLVVLLCLSFVAAALITTPMDDVSPTADRSPADLTWEEKMSVPYTVPDDCVTDEMRATRAAMLEKYPGLIPVDPASMDPSLPVIYLDSIEELDNLMAGVSAASLYRKNRDVRP